MTSYNRFSPPTCPGCGRFRKDYGDGEAWCNECPTVTRWVQDHPWLDPQWVDDPYLADKAEMARYARRDEA